MSQSNPENQPIGIGSERTDRFIKAVAAHPYICALLACLLLNPFYLGAAANVPPNALYIESLAVLLAGLALIYRSYRREHIDKRQSYVIAAAFFVLNCYGTKMYSQAQDRGLWLMIGGCFILLALYYFSHTKKFNTQLNALLIFGVSFFVKFYYIFYTSVYTRQNDVHLFGQEAGHAGYMEYLLFNHKLPDFDVRNIWQYCHPPLHHAICALWIDINENILGVGHDPARESLQTLSLFYTMTIMITAYKLLRRFRLDGMALYVPMLIISFHPSFILFSGAINNDVLSVAFMMGAVLCTLKWYDDQTLFGILKIALCVGLGMMTKLSAALVAPPIAIVFLVVFIRKIKTDGLKLFGQFAAFGAVCVPLGLWFEIRNYIKWKVPITYVQEMPITVTQYIGDRSFKSRITDFSSEQFKSVFEQWLMRDENGNLQGYNEYNPLVAILKNSLFGESINEGYFEKSQYVLMVAKVLFWLGMLLAAVFFVIMIVMLFKKCGMKPLEKTLFASFYFVMLFNFYKMCRDYPFTCTMNFRYITPTVIITSLFCGMFMQMKKDGEMPKSVAVISKAIMVMAAAFCMLTVMVYVTVCAPAPQQ